MLNNTESTFPDVASTDENGFDFGATPKLTTTLKRLVRAYPKDVGIIKEFIQNADDAGAHCVKIIMDWRCHPSIKLPDPKMKILMGPALLIFNDAVFSEDDLTSIQNIGESVKQVDTSKIGRFGLGFNATYNVTDYPSLLTTSKILFFDPHLNVIPGADYKKPGRGWKLSERVWQAYSDLLSPFQVLNSRFTPGQDYFNGTLFRLPLRTEDTYLESQIKQEPFTSSDFDFILGQLKRSGAELLLFLKNVTEITVSVINSEGVVQNDILSITTKNDSEVRGNRGKVNDAISDKPERLLEKIKAGDRELPKLSYTHHIQVEYDGCSEIQEWRLVSGLFADDAGEIFKITETMVNQKEKAFPWAGCAARIQVERNGVIVDEKLEGQAYCLLPLGIPTGLPVHINGVFDLDESRKMLTSGDMRGGDENRVKWNKLLVKHCVSRAYAGLITYLVNDLGSKSIRKYYDYWPDPDQKLPAALSELVINVYQRLQERKVLSSAADDKWKTIRELAFLQKPEGRLLDALLAEKFPLPSPLLPSWIINGFKQSGINPQFINPKWVRDIYRLAQPIQCEFSEAPRVSLQNREWVEALLQYCLSDSQGKDLKGVPLAVLSDGKLHTFGYFNNVAFFASEIEREIYSNEPHWFIDPTFARNCGLFSPLQEVGLFTMSVDNVIENLTAVLGKESEIEWEPTEGELPDEKWIITVFKYLTEKKSVGTAANGLNKLPLVPDQFSRLINMGKPSTPLLIPRDISDELLAALNLLEIPLVSGSLELIKAIEEFAQIFPDKFVRYVTGPYLVDLLNDTMEEWEELAKVYDKRIHEPLLNFLADEKNFSNYKFNGRLEKIKNFPILVAEDGEILKANQENIYISAGQTPPPVAGDIRLIQTGPNDRWRKLIELLEVQELGRPVLIKRVISSYPQLSIPKKVEAFRWIRKNLEAAEEQLENEKSRGEAETIRKLVAEAPLVICQTSDLASITKIYDPRVEIIQKVLGEKACIPDRNIYKQGERQWLEFFEKLGMAKSPRAADLITYIDSLINEAKENGAGVVVARIMAVYEHIRDNWEELSRQEIRQGTVPTTMQPSLYSRAWLPARRTEDILSQFPGFVIPQDRLYKSSELQMPRNGHLIASQCPIALITAEPQAKIRDGLGFPDIPQPDDVVRHFEILISKWESPDHSLIKEIELETSLRAIYEFLGDQFKNNLITPYIQKVRTQFKEKPCIWDFLDKLKNGKKFWKPRHTFTESVAYLTPFRIRIQHRSEREGRGFDALGRQETPLTDDYYELLNDLLSGSSGNSVDTKTADSVIYALEQIDVDQLSEDLSNFPVLTQEARIVKANEVFEFDAPWWAGKIEPNQIHLLDSKVPPKIRELAKIKQLSKFVVEKPLELPDSVSLPEIIKQCAFWQKTLQSQEFQRGLERIIKHTHHFGKLEGINLLKRLKVVTIIPVEKIQTQLILIESNKVIGSNEGDYFYDEENASFYIVAKNEDDLDFVVEFLAQSLNEQLEKFTLSDLSPLVKIINLHPEKIDSTLTRLRIRQLTYQEAIYTPIADDDSAIEPLPDDGTIDGEKEPDASTSKKIGVGKDTTSKESENSTEKPGTESSEPVSAGVAQGSVNDMSDQGQKKEAGPRKVNGTIDSQYRKTADSPKSSGGNNTSDTHKADDDTGMEATGSNTTNEPGSSSYNEPNEDQSPNSSNSSTSPSLSRAEQPVEARKWPRRMKHSRPSKRNHLTISRVFSEKHAEKLNRLENSDDEAPHNIEVGNAAVQRVLDFENAAGCEVENMPHKNPGFDVISITPDGNTTKYIEVKGVDGPWTEDGVPLSSTQFVFGQNHVKPPSEEYWLYVVEYARDDSKYKVYPISNPTGLVTQFRYDSGWKELAITFEKPLEPADGLRIQMEDGRIALINRVIPGQGSMLKLSISYNDGTDEIVKYRKSSMKLLNNEE